MAKTIGEIVRFSLLMEVRIIGHQVLSIGWIVFCVARRPWSGWKQALILVRAKTVVRWHRAGFVCIGVGFQGQWITRRPAANLAPRLGKARSTRLERTSASAFASTDEGY